MYEKCLNEAERMLATSKEVVLPIKDVWRMLSAEGKRRSFEVPALTDFDALLEGDKRFEVLSAQTEPDQIELLLSEDGEELDSNLGTLGFYPEDRVKLRRIKLPPSGVQNRDTLKDSIDDEEVVPFTVKGLSATKRVHRVEAKRQSGKKTSPNVSPPKKSSARIKSKRKTNPHGKLAPKSKRKPR